MDSVSAEFILDLSKHYIHEIDALVSLDRAQSFALENKTRKNSYIVVQKLLVYQASIFVAFKCTKYILCCVIYARAAGLFVYGHPLSHSYMSDKMVGRAL